MFRALRSVVATFDRVSSRLMGQDGAVRNVQAQLDAQRLACERVEALGQRLLAGSARAIPRAA